MTQPALPWLSGAVIELLAANAEFMDACDGRVSGKTPGDASAPYVTVRTLTNTAISARAGAYRATSRITAWSPPATSDTAQDPFLTVWQIAVLAAAAVAPAEKHQQTYQNIFYTPIIQLGPTEDLDTSRGPDFPMYGCYIEVELTVKAMS